MSFSWMEHSPLTDEAKALKGKILSIPSTSEPLLGLDKDSPDQETLIDLHALAIAGEKSAVPEIRRALVSHPHSPVLLNYLLVAHQTRDEPRQAAEVLKRMAREHPDYLFTRIALASAALEKNKLDQALEQLGASLDIRDLYPQRPVFHLSELRNYYLTVALLLAGRGDPQLARGVQSALMQLEGNEEVDKMIDLAVMRANLLVARKRIADDRKRRIEVRHCPLPRRSPRQAPPAFRHGLINELYEHGFDLPTDTIDAILALPRESLLQDLLDVLDDCITHSGYYITRRPRVEGESMVIHVVHLLAEIDGWEGCGHLLRLLEMHPEVVRFWMGNDISLAPQIATIISRDHDRCFAWLRTPGISTPGKCVIGDALVYAASTCPELHDGIARGLADVMMFVADSPAKDNILDTQFISLLIHMLCDLRATEHLPTIRMAYDRGLVELMMVGDIGQLEQEMASPVVPGAPCLPMARQYQAYLDLITDDDATEEWQQPADEEFEEDETDHSLDRFGLSLASKSLNQSPPPKTVGRNEPCPCGSGKKFKKCCMP